MTMWEWLIIVVLVLALLFSNLYHLVGREEQNDAIAERDRLKDRMATIHQLSKDDVEE
jgi:hypothetical protein